MKAFEGAKADDAAAVSSALSSAMTRIASTRRSGVDSVTAPVGAETTTEAVADGVKATPAGGDLAAALVRLSSVALARGALQLSGHVLAPSVGGPGLALTLAKANGGVIERLTIRAADFEPSVGPGEAPACREETDRMLRVATAGAVWTHFKILEEVWRLTDAELEKTLATHSWRSYALMRIGIEGEEHYGPDFTRALYAKAVEADSGNLVAQFNLASLELKDELLSQVRVAGGKRLDLVHERLHAEYAKAPVEQGGGVEDERMRLLLNLDPLCYQVCYKRVAAKLNNDVVLEAEQERRMSGGPASALRGRYPYGHWVPQSQANGSGGGVVAIDGSSLSEDDLEDLTKHLRNLEWTLRALERPAFGLSRVAPLKRWTAERWTAERSKRRMERRMERRVERSRRRMERSKRRMELRRLLVELEGPMLVLWAMVALRVDSSNGCLPAADLVVKKFTPPSPPVRSGPANGQRDWLIERLGRYPPTLDGVAKRGPLKLGEAVGFARSAEVSPSSRTRLNLACWYADVDRPADSLRQVALGIESGSELVEGWLSDAQLRRVGPACRKEWRVFEERSQPSHARTSENGHRRSLPSLVAGLVSLSGGRGG